MIPESWFLHRFLCVCSLRSLVCCTFVSCRRLCHRHSFLVRIFWVKLEYFSSPRLGDPLTVRRLTKVKLFRNSSTPPKRISFSRSFGYTQKYQQIFQHKFWVGLRCHSVYRRDRPRPAQRTCALTSATSPTTCSALLFQSRAADDRARALQGRS